MWRRECTQVDKPEGSVPDLPPLIFPPSLPPLLQVKILKACDDKPLDFLLADHGDATKLVGTLLKLVSSVSEVVVQQYALTHIEDILSEDLPKVRACPPSLPPSLSSSLASSPRFLFSSLSLYL